MSGFLPDLANWALRGGAGNNNNNNDDDDDDNDNDSNNSNDDEQQQQQQQQPSSSSDPNPPPLTADEMRAQRLARMEELQRRQQQEQAAAAAAAATAGGGGPEPMDVEPPSFNNKKDEAAAAPAAAASKPKPQPVPENTTPNKQQQKQQQHQASSSSSSTTPRKENYEGRKLQRKKEQLLRKVLGVTFKGSSPRGSSSGSPSTNTFSSDGTSLVALDLDSSSAGVTEILVERISRMPSPNDRATSSSRNNNLSKPLLQYLGMCHKRASEELKTCKNDDLACLLKEIQSQSVSYAATCLVEPELFDAGQDSVTQLTQALISSVSDVGTSITIGTSGTSSSFYFKLIDEIVDQHGVDPLQPIVKQAVDILMQKLAKCKSALDNVDGAESGMMLISALTAMCVHKKVAAAVTQLPCFLLPAAGSPQANELIRPSFSSDDNPLLRMLGPPPAYHKRSGPGIEKHTVLGLCVRLGIPSNKSDNSTGFSPATILHQSVDSTDRINKTQRNQLKLVQEATYQFVMSLLKADKAIVLKWIQDALLVNSKADGYPVDVTKVSSTSFLLNLNMLLLKLCQPIIDKEDKLELISPGFVNSPDHHGGMFVTDGDEMVTRLGGSDEDSTRIVTDYNPRNVFIPSIFFYCARSLSIGLAPQLSNHEHYTLRQISALHWRIRNSGRSVAQDPNFAMLVYRQRVFEISLLQPELVQESLRFGNYMSLFLLKLSDDQLKTIPEHFVSDVMSIFKSISNQEPSLLKSIDLRYLFELVVKLLSPQYAGMIRNYNLRAQLGDILYAIFLPPEARGDRGGRHDIPPSAYTDPLAGGTPYLLSNTAAQESLAPSLLLLYGEVEQTGYYEKMSHRAKISQLIKYLWDSSEHRSAFKCITHDKESFIKFANGIMNETNRLISEIMQKLPQIREAQMKMKDAEEWGRLSEDEQKQITERLSENEDEVKSSLPLCNKTLQMFRYLNKDPEIRQLFQLDELCPRLVNMLLHVLNKLVGHRGLELRVDNPESYEFKPKEMLRDLCSIFALFSTANKFQEECAKANCQPELLRQAAKTCKRLGLLTGDSMVAFTELPDAMDLARKRVAQDELLYQDAPDRFLDPVMTTYMKDPVYLPTSNTVVDRSTIAQHLLNDPTDPFNRKPLTMDEVVPAAELKAEMDTWLEEKRSEAAASADQDMS